MTHRASFLASLAAALTILFAAAPARAGVTAHADADLVIPFGDGSSALRPGWAFGGRLGYAIGIGPIELTPELGGGAARIPFSDHDPSAARVFPRIIGGARVTLDGLVAPSAWLHVGYGWLDGSGDSGGLDGPLIESGLALDVRLIPIFNFGAHAGYQRFLPSDTPRYGSPTVPNHWVALGVHVGLRL